MNRRLALALPLALLAAASGPSAAVPETLDAALARATAEAAGAERRAAALTAEAAKAGDQAARLRAEREAAAAGIAAAEARIAAADMDLQRARGQVALARARLDARRAPIAALLSGMVTMARQPPILTLADGGSIDELVRVRLLLDSTLPEIARRSAALSAELSATERGARRLAAVRGEQAAARRLLDQRRTRFAALERQASERAASLSGAAFGAEEQVLAGSEQVADLGGASRAAAAARANARRVAALPLAPPRPVAGEAGAAGPALAYSLPAPAPVVEGLGAVSPVGVRARGVRLATARGAALIVPADGTVRFAGAFREHDGVVILDHGGGWTSLLLGVATPLQRGATVRRGAPLGRALGPVTVELRRGATPVSPALIAGSSHLLSNSRETR